MHNRSSIDSPAEFDAASLSADLIRCNPVLIEKITAALGCKDRETQDALREVLRFMLLVSKQESAHLTPSHRVDLAWHEFILCTVAYQEFCTSHFGKMIHHFPGGSKEVHRGQYAKTLERYEMFFGEPDPQFWGSFAAPRDAECGACESF